MFKTTTKTRSHPRAQHKTHNNTHTHTWTRHAHAVDARVAIRRCEAIVARRLRVNVEDMLKDLLAAEVRHAEEVAARRRHRIHLADAVFEDFDSQYFWEPELCADVSRLAVAKREAAAIRACVRAAER